MDGAGHVLLRAAATAFYGGGHGARLPILMYHRVLGSPDVLQPGVPDAGLLNAQLEAIARVFNVLPLDQAIDQLAQGRLPPRSVAITFDDGYRDNHDVALPILRRLGLTATFFVATGFLDGGRMFNDTVLECVRRLPPMALDLGHLGVPRCEISDAASRVVATRRVVATVKYQSAAQRAALCRELEAMVGESLPDTLMMTSDHVRHLVQQGMSVGGHTVTHPILRLVDDAVARDEIVRNRDDLRSITGVVPACFAYPNGKPAADFGPAHVAMVREAGYAAALSTAYAVPGPDSDRYQLPRFVPVERSAAALVGRMIRMGFHRSPEQV